MIRLLRILGQIIGQLQPEADQIEALRRGVVLKWRDTALRMTLAVQQGVSVVILGTIFWGQQSVRAQANVLYFVLLFASYGMIRAIPSHFETRRVFVRERAELGVPYAVGFWAGELSVDVERMIFDSVA